MGTWLDVHNGIVSILRDRYSLDVKRVLTLRQGSDENETVVAYEDNAGVERKVSWYGSMSDSLAEALDEA